MELNNIIQSIMNPTAVFLSSTHANLVFGDVSVINHMAP